MSAESLLMVLTQWIIALVIVIAANIVYQYFFVRPKQSSLDCTSDAEGASDVELSVAQVRGKKPVLSDETTRLITRTAPQDLDTLTQKQTKDDFL
jgi:hypothetical protein